MNQKLQLLRGLQSVKVKFPTSRLATEDRGYGSLAHLTPNLHTPLLSHASSPPLLSSASHLKMKPDFNFADLALAFKWTLGVCAQMNRRTQHPGNFIISIERSLPVFPRYFPIHLGAACMCAKF